MAVLDTQILGELQEILVEPNDGGLTWPSGLWTAPEVVDYLNQRQRRFLQETQAVVKRSSQGIVPAVPRQAIAQNWVGTRRVAFQPEGFDLFNGLKSFWRLNEAGGLARADSIGPNNLADVGGVAAAPGITQGAAVFSAPLTNALTITDGAQVGLNPGINDFSISVWFFPTVADALIHQLLGKGATGVVGFPTAADEGYSITLVGSTNVSFPAVIGVAFGDGSGAGQGLACFFAQPYTMNAWNHLVLTFARATVVTGYLNGTQMTVGFPAFGSSNLMSFHASSVGPCNPVANFSIGSSSSNIFPPNLSAFFNGRVDAVGWWNRVLLPAEVAVLYNQGLGRELFPAVSQVVPTGTSYQALSPGDQFEMDQGIPAWATTPITRPALYSDADPQTLEMVILPPSVGNGTLHFLFVEQPTTLTGAGTAFSVPDEFVPTLKWGALEDMLSKVGRAHDPIRAQIAGQFYSFGVEAAKALMGGFA